MPVSMPDLLSDSSELHDLTQDEILKEAPKDSQGRFVLGNAVLEHRIGLGSTGAVYFGRDPKTDDPLAVKVLDPQFTTSNDSTLRRFINEARVAARVIGPHLVRIITVDRANSLYYLVMDYVYGLSGHEYLYRTLHRSNQYMPVDEALTIATAACAGLADAHRADIIHRDMKPGNVLIPWLRPGELLDFPGTKVTDLGLAKMLGPDGVTMATMANTGLGTPGFLAPEQGRDAASVGKPADVWGLGATLFALLTGRAPFEGDNTINTVMLTIREPHPDIRKLNPNVPRPLKRVIDRCLEKDPRKRYPDAGALLEALQDVGGQQVATLDSDDEIGELARPISDDWFYQQAGEAVGPVTLEQLQQWLTAGQLTPATLVRGPLTEEWHRADTVNELRGVLEREQSDAQQSPSMRLKRRASRWRRAFREMRGLLWQNSLALLIASALAIGAAVCCALSSEATSTTQLHLQSIRVLALVIAGGVGLLGGALTAYMKRPLMLLAGSLLLLLMGATFVLSLYNVSTAMTVIGLLIGGGSAAMAIHVFFGYPPAAKSWRQALAAAPKKVANPRAKLSQWIAGLSAADDPNDGGPWDVT